MKQSKLVSASVAVFFLFTLAVCGQDPAATPNPSQNIPPEKLALIRELLDLSNPKKLMDSILAAQAEQMEKQMPEIVWQSVSDMKELQALTPAQREQLHDEVVDTSIRTGRKVFDLLIQKIDFPKMVSDISIPLYDKYFTEAELRDIVTFYKSGTGKKVLESMPTLANESITLTSEMIAPKIRAIIAEIQAEETAAMTKEIQVRLKANTKPPPRTSRGRSKH